MHESCTYNTFYKVFVMLTKVKHSLILFIYLNFLESFYLSFPPNNNSSDIVYPNIKEISKKYQRNIKEISKKYQRNIKEISKKYNYFILNPNYFYIIINLKFRALRVCGS